MISTQTIPVVWLLLVARRLVKGDVNVPEIECPPKWIKFQDTCYRIYNRPVTFSAAEVGCQDDFKGRLAILNTKEKAVFVKNQFFTPNNKFRKNTWIALIRTQETNTDSSFKWLDNSSVSYTNWQHGEPNNFWGLQYCVALWGGQKQSATWYDYWCDTEMFALCERELEARNSSREEIVGIEPEKQENNTIWTLLIAVTVLCIILLIVVAVICFVADFTRAKRAATAKTDVWFKRVSEDKVSLGQDNSNIINNNYNPPEKVLNIFVTKA